MFFLKTWKYQKQNLLLLFYALLATDESFHFLQFGNNQSSFVILLVINIPGTIMRDPNRVQQGINFLIYKFEKT